MRPALTLSLAVASLGFFAGSGEAQPGSPISVQQISPSSAARPAAEPLRIAPDRASSSSASETATVPTVPPEVIEACRAAQAEDRPPPRGIDCIAALQAMAQAAPPVTAESSLLEMFGQRGNINGRSAARASDAGNADAAARQLATGDVGTSGSGAAAIIASQRAAPPPTSPR